jgi:hypothetical protein
MTKANVVKTLTELGAQSVLRGFDAEDAGDKINLWCKKCEKGWALKKTSSAIGNVLHLLNHEASHRTA